MQATPLLSLRRARYAQGVNVRRLMEQDAERLWHFRLRALQLAPPAFGEAAEEHRQSTVEQTAGRLRQGGELSVTFGAFEGEKLIGMVGVFRLNTIKRRHKAAIWGMFVEEEHRGLGAGRLLLEEAIRAAREMPEVRAVGLSVITTNEAARRLYLRAGFRPWGLEPHALHVDGEFYNEEYMLLEL